ncbi:hypothetical protein Pcac1_g8932 [Phytophthora cactorum]|nr:hypothetical protein Pcac1_g8932 [Phytophthora cactorum]
MADEEFNSSSGRITTTSAKSPAFKASPNSAMDISSSSNRAFTAGREYRLMSPSTPPVTPLTIVYNSSLQSRGASLLVTLDTWSDIIDVKDALRLILLSLRDRDQPDEVGVVTSPSPRPGATSPSVLNEGSMSRETRSSEHAVHNPRSVVSAPLHLHLPGSAHDASTCGRPCPSGHAAVSH